MMTTVVSIKSIIDCKMLRYQVHLSDTVCTNIVFVMANPRQVQIESTTHSDQAGCSNHDLPGLSVVAHEIVVPWQILSRPLSWDSKKARYSDLLFGTWAHTTARASPSAALQTDNPLILWEEHHVCHPGNFCKRGESCSSVGVWFQNLCVEVSPTISGWYRSTFFTSSCSCPNFAVAILMGILSYLDIIPQICCKDNGGQNNRQQ